MGLFLPNGRTRPANCLTRMDILEKISKNGRSMLLAYDQGMEHGPTDFSDANIDPTRILEIAESGYFTGVILQKGIAEKYYQKGKNRVPLIVKLNGKTRLEKDSDPYSPQLCSVAEAVELGASAVGYTVYVGSHYESQMMTEFSRIEQEAEKYQLPVIGWMYPRGKAVEGKEKSPEMIAYAARIGLEMGADMVKIHYTGDVASFSWVVKAAGKTKVLAVGGESVAEEILFKTATEIISAGAVGMAIGRNIWQAEKPLERAKKLAEIIYV